MSARRSEQETYFSCGQAEGLKMSGNYARLGTEILVNNATIGSQDDPAITSLPSGGFVITWRDGSLARPIHRGF